MKTKYKPKTITGAQRRVRELMNQLDDYRKMFDRVSDENRRLKADRIRLAKLAAKGPCFFNPLDAMAAENLRDGILYECGLNPDGSFIPKT